MRTPLYILGLLALLPTILLSQTIYVDVDATDPTPDGSSWAEAYSDLQDALATAASGDEIWVAEGTYYPDLSAGIDSDDSNATFTLINGVAIYGGFVGHESLLEERDPNPVTNGTTLSGFIRPGTGVGIPDLRSENVVTASGTNNTARLDGFTITDGHATGTNRGGGLLANPGSDAIFENISFENNLCAFVGGAAYFNGGAPSFINVTFKNNQADGTSSSGSSVNGEGGALYLNNSSPSFINCLFHDNVAANDGGAISNHNSNISFLNCTFSSNNSAETGDAVYNSNASSTPSFTNTIVWGNVNVSTSPSIAGGAPSYSHSLIEDLNPTGTGNLDGTDLDNDPDFVSTSDFRLLPFSPAIDTGNSASNSITTDLAASPRIADAAIDLGAYEHPVTPRHYVNFDNALPVAPYDTWATAATSLQDALALSAAGDEIWVALGLYYPDEGVNEVDNDVNASFVLKSGVAIYGGFVGTETLLSERNPNPFTNISILCGDVDGNSSLLNNSHRVVTASNTDANTRLDGFSITAGHARDLKFGAAIFASNANGVFENLNIENNRSTYLAGGVYLNNSNCSFINVTFHLNEAEGTSTGTAAVNGEGWWYLLECERPGFRQLPLRKQPSRQRWRSRFPPRLFSFFSQLHLLPEPF